MPFLFLSPSTQYFNLYITEESERYWMNLVADAMEPYLLVSGVNVTRNDPEGSAALSIRQSNLGEFDFHLALHSNAAPESLSGQLRGIDAYYYPTSVDGLRMAELIVDALKAIYPLPNRVQALSSTTIGEVRRTRAPSCLVEIGYHDNPDDAAWITSNVPAIGRSLALAVTQYFALPFLEPGPVYSGLVATQEGAALLRGGPETSFPVVARIPSGSTITVYQEYNGWYVAAYNGVVGYLASQLVTLEPA